MPMTRLSEFLNAKRGRQARLAEEIGVSPGYISDVVNGKKPGTIKLFRMIAAATGLQLADLLGEHQVENEDDSPRPNGFGEPDATPFKSKSSLTEKDVESLARRLVPDAKHMMLYTAQRDFPGFCILKGDLLVIGTPQKQRLGDVVIANLSDDTTASVTTVLRQRAGDRIIPPISGGLPDEESLSCGILGTLLATLRSPALG